MPSTLSSIAGDLKRATKANKPRRKRKPAQSKKGKFAVYTFASTGEQMHRKTLYLSADELDAVKQQADTEGISVTQVIRHCIREQLPV